MHRRLVFISALLGLGLATGACSGGDSSVSMVGQTFQPASMTVPAGTTLTFTNESDEAHTVTALQDGIPEGADYFASGGFSTESQARQNIADGLIPEGESFEVTLRRPGEYEYFCIPHEAQGMEGTITVEE
jgi:plastocyanin